MANTFIPYNVRLDDITTNSVTVTWDIHNTAEFRTGTFYHVYVKANLADPTPAPIVANTTTVSINLTEDNRYVAVSSIVAGEESPISAYVEIDARIGVTDSENSITIAVDAEGRPVKLRVNSDGDLLVSGISGSGSFDLASEETLADVLTSSLAIQASVANMDTNVGDISTTLSAVDASLDTIENILTSVRSTVETISSTASNSYNLLSVFYATMDSHMTITTAQLTGVMSAINSFKSANHVDLTALSSQLSSIETKLDALQTSIDSGSSVLLRAEATITGVGTAGTKVILPWNERSIIKQITVLLEGGSATDFSIKIYNKAITTLDRDVVIEETLSRTYSQNRLDFIHSVPYINMDGNNEMILKVTPNLGTSNIFYIVINGEKAK